MKNECPSSERLSAYLDGEVGAEESARLAGHVTGCEACAAVVLELRQASGVVRGMKVPAMSGALKARLDRQAERFAWRGPQRLAGFLSAVAAGVAIVCAWPLLSGSEATAAPQSWERAAVQLTAEDAGVGSRETSLAEWMVAGLGSHEKNSGAGREGAGRE